MRAYLNYEKKHVNLQPHCYRQPRQSSIRLKQTPHHSCLSSPEGSSLLASNRQTAMKRGPSSGGLRANSFINRRESNVLFTRRNILKKSCMDLQPDSIKLTQLLLKIIKHQNRTMGLQNSCQEQLHDLAIEITVLESSLVSLVQPLTTVSQCLC